MFVNLKIDFSENLKISMNLDRTPTAGPVLLRVAVVHKCLGTKNSVPTSPDQKRLSRTKIDKNAKKIT